ncbi:MAG: T9SS type A sorting domain-containing protein [Bacteroidia bacterium]
MCNTVVFAQNTFAPLGAYWNYGYINQCVNGNATLKVTKDSMLNGYATKTITRYEILKVCPTQTIDTIITNLGTLQLRNDSVFAGNHYATPITEHYLYSFIMKVGDTLSTGNDAKAFVVNIDSINVNGYFLKRWTIYQYCVNPYNGYEKLIHIIENIGPINEYLFWSLDVCSTDPSYNNFECYNGGTLTYNTPCAIVLGEFTKIKQINIIKIAPNPTYTGSVELQTASANNKIITVKNNLGITVIEENTSQTTISLTLNQSGIYFVTIVEKGTVQTQKIIVL